MYRGLLSRHIERQWQRIQALPLHPQSTFSLCIAPSHDRLLRNSFIVPPPSIQSRNALIRSLANSTKKPQKRPQPTPPRFTQPPTTPSPSTLASASTVGPTSHEPNSTTRAAAAAFLTPVLTPIFGSHTTPLRLLILLTLVALTHLTIADLFTGHGPSMSPTFATAGEVFLVEALSRHSMLAWHSLPVPIDHRPVLSRLIASIFQIGRGDIILCNNPLRQQAAIAKRITGMPGDIVRTQPSNPHSLCRVPAMHVWVQGDCLEASRDSREYGAVPMELVRGKVIAKVWPLSRAEWFEPTLQYRGY